MKLQETIHNILAEEFSHGVLYGYHVTSQKNLDSIRKHGFRVGERKMQGNGFYAFYSKDHAIGYGMKGEINEPILVKFAVKYPHAFIILNMDIAKQVFGDEYHLKDQIDRYYKYEGGFDYFVELVKLALHNRNVDTDFVLSKLAHIENDNGEMNQRTFWATMLPRTENDKLNLVLDGYYGLEYRINSQLHNLKIIGYEKLNDNESVEFSVLDDVPETEEFKKLREFIIDNHLQDKDLVYIENIIEDQLDKVKSNREFNYYVNLSDSIRKIK